MRRSETLRRMVRETRLSRDDLVYPLFVVVGSGVREPVASMPGVFRFSVDALVIECKEVSDLGIPAVLLFGVPDEKDARGSGADAANGVVQRAVEAVKCSPGTFSAPGSAACPPCAAGSFAAAEGATACAACTPSGRCTS